MLEVVKNESKNQEEALTRCLEELNVNLNEVYYYIEDGTQIPLTETPFIDNELFTELTGSTFRTINT